MTSRCACPNRYPQWHEQDIDLSGKPVHALKIPSFLYMPLSYEMYVQKQRNDIKQLELEEEWPGFVLTRTGFLRGELISLLTSGDSPSRFVRTLEGIFQLRGYLHNGGIGTVKQSIRTLQMQLFDLGRMPRELYLCYLTCPVCSGQKGGDKILLLRRWKESPTLAKRIKAQKTT
ncbi:MAG TPA: hydrolase [Gammaproteobacteria bacterium]